MNKINELERLSKLKESGVISNEEFEVEKEKILKKNNNVNVSKMNENIVKNYTEKAKVENRQVRNRNIKLTILIFSITLLFMIIICVVVPVIQKNIEKSKEVQVPNLIGKTISEAEQEASTSKLSIKVEDAFLTTLYSDNPDAIIVEQEDKEGTILKKGDSIRVKAKTEEQLDKEKQEKEEAERKAAEAKEKGYRSSPASESTIIGCAKTLINNILTSSSTAVWGNCEKIDEDNYGRCLVYVSLEAQNGFGGYSKLNYLVVLQYVKANGEFTYKPYVNSYQLTLFGEQSVYDYYITPYIKGNVPVTITNFLNKNDWNIRPKDV